MSRHSPLSSRRVNEQLGGRHYLFAPIQPFNSATLLAYREARRCHLDLRIIRYLSLTIVGKSKYQPLCTNQMHLLQSLLVTSNGITRSMTIPHRLLVKAEAQVHNNLQSMTRLARQALEEAMDALKTQNAELARKVVEEDLKQNHLMRIIEQECLQIISTLEPKASDLREVVVSMQIASELERISDHAKGIANIVLTMDSADFSGPMDRIGAMGDMCQDMIDQVMESYTNQNTDLAMHVIRRDKQVDELDEEACSSLMMTLMTSADTGMHATHLLWIAHHLERIGDRVSNIGERVVFMVTADTPDLN